MSLRYRLFEYAPTVVIQSPFTAVFVGAAHAALVVYLVLAAVDIGRGLAFAALNYSLSQRFVLLGTSREKGTAAVFDTAEGSVTSRKLPDELK